MENVQTFLKECTKNNQIFMFTKCLWHVCVLILIACYTWYLKSFTDCFYFSSVMQDAYILLISSPHVYNNHDKVRSEDMGLTKLPWQWSNLFVVLQPIKVQYLLMVGRHIYPLICQPHIYFLLPTLPPTMYVLHNMVPMIIIIFYLTIIYKLK